MNDDQLVLILAGHAQEANAWRRSEGLKGRDWRYAGSPRAIDGARPTRVVELSGFWNNHYAPQILRSVRHALAKLEDPVEIEHPPDW